MEKIKYRYSYHLSPANGWMNDPNGLIYYNDFYHIFYQVNPIENRPGDIYWGHYISKDLISWEEVDFALSPDENYDTNGCYSGGAFILNEELYLIYTGHKDIGDSYEETQCLAVSNDGKVFKKIDSNPVISKPPVNNTHRFRDPKVYRINNSLFMIIGGESSIDGTGQVQIYESDDSIEKWVNKGLLIKARNGDGTMWECPDYFELANKKFLIVSPKGMENEGINGFCSVWIEHDDFFVKEVSEYHLNKIDYGQDFYAAQSFYDPVKQRRILIAWFGMPGLQEKESNQQVGALTLPREIKVVDDELYFYPIEELKELRRENFKLKENQKIIDTSEVELINVKNSFEIKIKNDTMTAFYTIRFKECELMIEFRDSLRNERQVIQDVKVSDLRLFLDNGLTELYINQGKYTLTNKCDLIGNLTMDISGDIEGNLYYLR